MHGDWVYKRSYLTWTDCVNGARNDYPGRQYECVLNPNGIYDLYIWTT